jgi:ribosomal-protein-serine acetyltransferase
MSTTEMERIELTPGCELRLLTQADAEELYALVERNRGHLARWMPWAADQTFEKTAAFIQAAQQRLAANNGFEVAVVVDGRIAGAAGFSSVDWVARSTSLGYWLGQEHQGRGLMTRTVSALIDHAFGEWELHRLEIRAAVDNARSRAIPERLGFRQEGILREAERVGDRYQDLVVYGLLADEPRGASADERRH